MHTGKQTPPLLYGYLYSSRSQKINNIEFDDPNKQSFFLLMKIIFFLYLQILHFPAIYSLQYLLLSSYLTMWDYSRLVTILFK